VLVPISHEFGPAFRRWRIVDHAHIDGPTLGAVHLWFVRRQIWTARPAHDGHCFLLGHGLLTAFAPIHCISDFGARSRSRQWAANGDGRVARNESLPTQTRGLFSGFCRRVTRLVIFARKPWFTWWCSALRLRGLFVRWCVTALLVVYIRAHVPESPVWQRDADRQTLGLRLSIYSGQHASCSFTPHC